MATGYPWRTGRSVQDVVDCHRTALVRAGLIERGRGYDPAHVAAWASRRISPPPAEVLALWGAAKPRAITTDDFPSMRLLTIEEPEARWYSMVGERPHPLDLIWGEKEPLDADTVRGWETAEGFMIGATPFHDRAFIIRRQATIPDGSIVVTDHEGSQPLPVVARSLAEYLERLCRFGGVDLASMPGERDNFPMDDVLLLAQELEELNRGEAGTWPEWAARVRLRRAHPKGHPDGYHVWDPRAKRLVAIGAADELPAGQGGEFPLQLQRPSRREIESLTRARGLRSLMICDGQIPDLSLLAQIPALADLSLYDCGVLDVTPLATAAGLREVYFLRCTVRGIAALTALADLRRLRLQECTVDELDLQAFALARRDVQLT